MNDPWVSGPVWIPEAPPSWETYLAPTLQPIPLIPGIALVLGVLYLAGALAYAALTAYAALKHRGLPGLYPGVIIGPGLYLALGASLVQGACLLWLLGERVAWARMLKRR